MHTRPSLKTIAIVTSAALVSVYCGGTSDPEPPVPIPTTVTVTPTSVTLTAIGASATLTATVKDQNGNTISATVDWTSTNSAVVTVDASGKLTSTGVGTAQVTARSGNAVSTPVDVTVTQVASSVAKGGDAQTGTVGAALANPITATLTDISGSPVAGATVSFAVTSGGGSVATASATTDASGVASTAWTLGTVVGANGVMASVSGTSLTASYTATGTADVADTIRMVSGNAQSGQPLQVMAESLAVMVVDQFGNAVDGERLAISTTGGAVANPPAPATKADGIAKTELTLGPTAGVDSAIVTLTGVNGSPVTFTATATLGTPASVTVSAGDNQSAIVGTAVAVAPAVLVQDAGGGAVSGIEVTFAVTGGGGSITGATDTTDINGIATVGGWTLGGAVGANTLSATVAGLTPVVFTANGTQTGPPATVEIVNGNGQNILAGATAVIPPSVVVKDSAGNLISGASVTFAVTAGGGSIAGSPATTDSTGVAAAGLWTYGAGAGTNSVTASVGGATSAVFSGTGATAGYNIELRQLDTPSAAVDTAFMNAKARWEGLVVGDLTNIDFSPSPVAANACGITHPSLADVIDDLMIWVRLEAIDGAGGVLGSAGPCITRTSDSTTIVGIMRFDTADLDSMVAQGTIGDVILHEMGHVLGIGTRWPAFGLLQNPSLPSSPGVDTYFSGNTGIVAFDRLGGTSYTGGEKVPVENTQGGQGTQDGHWRETVFGNELMTGFISAPGNPLSLLTIGSLADLNLVINPDGADTYNQVFTVNGATGTGGIELKDDIFNGPLYVVDEQGNIRRVR